MNPIARAIEMLKRYVPEDEPDLGDVLAELNGIEGDYEYEDVQHNVDKDGKPSVDSLLAALENMPEAERHACIQGLRNVMQQ